MMDGAPERWALRAAWLHGAADAFEEVAAAENAEKRFGPGLRYAAAILRGSVGKPYESRFQAPELRFIVEWVDGQPIFTQRPGSTIGTDQRRD
jgi:hypothetical protein